MKLKRLISLLLVVATIAGMLTVFGGLAVTAAEITDSEKQLLGYGYNVTAGKSLSRSSLVIAQPILDVNDPEVLSSIYVMDLTEQTATNTVAESARELTTKMGSALAGGIGGNIGIVSMDIGLMFDRSQTVSNAISERYEIYYTEISRRQVILQMEVSELRKHLSSRFSQDIASIKGESDAITFLNKYGTHLFTGYKMGGRMSVTNYRITNSQSVNLDQTVDLKAQIGAAAASAGAGASFSITEKYGVDASDTSQKSNYHFVAQGGRAVAGLTLDQLFTYNPNLIGDGKYMYQAWIDAINNGENLDIIDAANGAQAIPVWELLEQTPANSQIRGHLVRAYAKLCGNKLNEYNAKYPYLNRDFGEETDDFYPTGTVTEYYTSSAVSNGTLTVNGPMTVEDSTAYTVADNATIYAVAECEIKVGEKNWRVISGEGNVEIVDSVEGVFRVTGSDGGSFTLGLYSGETELDSVIFNIKASAFSGGLGTEAEPYLISTAEDLATLLNESKWFTKEKTHYLLTADIDASGLRIRTAMTANQAFRGVFDGGYHTVRNYQAESGTSNVYPSGSGCVGLFGCNRGTIKNLKVENLKINMSSATEVYPGLIMAGVLVGDNYGTVSNCVVRNCNLFIKNEDTAEKDAGTIDYVFVGGIAGRSSGTIENSGVIHTPLHGEVKMDGAPDGNACGVSAVGGMVGVLMNNGALIGCYVEYDDSDVSRTMLVAQVEGNGNYEKEKYRACGRAYAGGLIGWASKEESANGCRIVDCIIDVPKVLYAFLNNCDMDGKDDYEGENKGDLITEKYAGSVVGKSGGGTIPNSTDFLVRNLVLAVSSRAPLQVAQSTAVQDGAGNGTMILSNEAGTVWNISEWGYNALSGHGYFNGDVWTEGEDTNVANKAFVMDSIQFSGYDKEYEYGQHWSPVGITAQLKTKAESKTLTTYMVDLGGFNATTIGSYVLKIKCAGKETSDTVKVVNTNIHGIKAKDTTERVFYLDDLYDMTDRLLSVEALLTNGQKIALMVDGVMQNTLSYVNYPQNATITFPNAKGMEFGENMVTLSYGDHTCTFIVEAEEDLLERIEIKKRPEYWVVGKRFSAGDMEVVAHYESGARKTVANSDLELIGDAVVEGENTVVISYGNYITEEIAVNGYVPLALKTMPTKTVYDVGDAIDWSGLTLNYTADGRSYRQLTAAECIRSADIITAVGNNEILLSYGGYSTKVTLIGREKITYSIVFIGYGGTVLSSKSYAAGATVEVPNAPAVDGYTFTGWDKPITVANDNVVYAAIYTPNTPEQPPATTTNYVITFVGQNGTVLSSESYAAGATVTPPVPPAVMGYTFTGWDREITVANGNTVYIAIYTPNAQPPVQQKTYLVTFVGHGGAVISSQSYVEGAIVTVPTAPMVEGYTFTGWDKTITAANADVVYVAIYQQNAPDIPVLDQKLLAMADTNGDGAVTHDDALLLLQRVHFNDIVIYASGDVNKDGKLTSDDAILLEKYVQNPAKYPIG